MPEVRNLLPFPLGSPRLSNSSSASRWSLSRASSAERTGLLDGEGKMGPLLSVCCNGDEYGDCEAVEDDEYVGFGWTTPISRSR